MSQIGDTENALLGLLRNCQLPSGVHIGSAPSTWDSGFVQRLIPSTPAILVAFLGAQPHADPGSSTSLNLIATWGVYAVFGWRGKTQEDRRLAVDAGYDVVARIAPILHNAPIQDPQHQRLPFPDVVSIETLTDSALDLGNLWVCEIQVEVELPLDIPVDCVGPLDDYLKTTATFDLPGVGHEFDPDAGDEIGTDGDATSRFDQPQ